jgi:hypothetical protein
MAIPVDESLQVDSVDTFLIFRCADAVHTYKVTLLYFVII